MQDCVVASSNLGKLAELERLLKPLQWRTRAQAEFGLDSPIEDGLSFVENALIKARHGSGNTGLPAIADDSGLVVPALGGEPGIYSARYSGRDATDERNIEALLKAMHNLKGKDRAAYFYCAIVYVRNVSDPVPIIAEGKIDGEILKFPEGQGGFGYDPVFYLPQQDCTMAMLDIKEKNRISHRAQALKKLVARLQDLNDD